MAKPELTDAELSRRKSAVEAMRHLKHSHVGSRVKLDGRVFFVRITSSNKVRIVERLVGPEGDLIEVQVWCEGARIGPLYTRVLEEVARQKAPKP